jgi:hypothetical protein
MWFTLLNIATFLFLAPMRSSKTSAAFIEISLKRVALVTLFLLLPDLTPVTCAD